MDLLKAGTSRASRSASALVVAILELNLCSPGMRSLFNHSFIETNFETKWMNEWIGEFSEAMRLNCEQEELSFFFPGFSES